MIKSNTSRAFVEKSRENKKLSATQHAREREREMSALVPFGKLNTPSPDPQDAESGEYSSKRQATRVFKKSSSNGKITVYLGKRDFTHADPIDGVVLIDPDYVMDRKVFGSVLAAFRYGREDLDVLGLTFRKDLYVAQEQIYPRTEKERPLTRLQERLIKKLGANAYPFYFEVPSHCPASVSLQPSPNGKT